MHGQPTCSGSCGFSICKVWIKACFKNYFHWSTIYWNSVLGVAVCLQRRQWFFPSPCHPLCSSSDQETGSISRPLEWKWSWNLLWPTEFGGSGLVSVLSLGLKRSGVFPLVLLELCPAAMWSLGEGHMDKSVHLEAIPVRPASNQLSSWQQTQEWAQKTHPADRGQIADPQKQEQNKQLLFQVRKLWDGLLLHEN